MMLTSVSKSHTEQLENEDLAYIDMITPRWYILSEEGTFLFYWDICVIFSAVYQGVFIPFSLFFIDVDSI